VARAVWTGSIGFGLVSIPVKLYPATVPRQVRFHQFARGTGQRIRHRMVIEGSPEPQPEPEPEMHDDDSIGRAEREWLAGALTTEVEVPFEDIVKGYEVSPGQFVMVEPEEIETLRPEPDHIIEIQGFVKLEEIDPVHFDKSYYIAPQFGASRPYALLLQAMREGQRVGVARFVLRTREYLAAIRPLEGILGL
jgi:DNA end-binding protein Ku